MSLETLLSLTVVSLIWLALAVTTGIKEKLGFLAMLVSHLAIILALATIWALVSVGFI